MTFLCVIVRGYEVLNVPQVDVLKTYKCLKLKGFVLKLFLRCTV